jgi:hypothetical protein
MLCEKEVKIMVKEMKILKRYVKNSCKLFLIARLWKRYLF